MEEGVKTAGFSVWVRDLKVEMYNSMVSSTAGTVKLHSPQRGKTVAWPVFCSICFFSYQEDIEEGVFLFRQSLGLSLYMPGCRVLPNGDEDLVRPCLSNLA